MSTFGVSLDELVDSFDEELDDVDDEVESNVDKLDDEVDDEIDNVVDIVELDEVDTLFDDSLVVLLQPYTSIVEATKDKIKILLFFIFIPPKRL